MNTALQTERSEDDSRFDRTLRPRLFADFIGQELIKEQLSIGISAVKRREEPLEHTLIYGPPGLGKTTIAHIIANERGVPFKQSSGPIIDKKGDIAALLTQLERFSVLFIDEIHRLPSHIEEILYPAMEDREFDILLGEGPSAQSIRIQLQPFTLIGATTRAGMLTSPMRDRFGHQLKLDYYDDVSLQEIIAASADKLTFDIDADALAEVARRSRGTPRVANRLLRRVRDFAQERGNGKANLPITQQALELEGIDKIGLDRLDTQYLVAILEKFAGGPVGLETLAASLGEESHTLEDVVEPFLIQRGFVMRTPRGRQVTDLALKHFHYTPKVSDGDLFKG